MHILLVNVLELSLFKHGSRILNPDIQSTHIKCAEKKQILYATYTPLIFITKLNSPTKIDSPGKYRSAVRVKSIATH